MHLGGFSVVAWKPFKKGHPQKGFVVACVERKKKWPVETIGIPFSGYATHFRKYFGIGMVLCWIVVDLHEGCFDMP